MSTPEREATDRELSRCYADIDRVTAERDGLQISLNTADQSIDDLNAAISRRTQRVRELETALAGMLFAFDDGVGREWSEDLLDFARKLTAAKEFKAALKPAEVKCKTCNGTRIVSDGAMYCSSGGIPFECGPIECVKDCPDCSKPSNPNSPPTAGACWHWHN
jgi:hypothetical protein